MVAFTKLIGFVFLIHAGYSLMKYRKYLIFNDRAEEFSIPLDVSEQLTRIMNSSMFNWIRNNQRMHEIYDHYFVDEFRP